MLEATHISEINSAYLQEKIDKLKNAPVLIVGDIMLDEYLIGDTTRISPEAPIPVVLIEKSHTMAGGAGNVARNIHDLGGKVCLVTFCGEDANGQKLHENLKMEGLDSSCMLRLKGHTTTTKTRIMARRQQMLRIDHEKTTPLNGEHLKAILENIKDNIATAKALVISDYGKGLVTPEFIGELKNICAAYPELPILIDPKLPNFHLYTDAFILTPNTKETSEGAGLPTRTPQELVAAGRAIFKKLGCKNLLTTLGPQGMALFAGPDEIWHIPTVAQDVFDVSGAGDTVIATVALSLAAGLDLLDACILANYAAGIVVAEVGAATANPQKMLAALANLPLPKIQKWS